MAQRHNIESRLTLLEAVVAELVSGKSHYEIAQSGGKARAEALSEEERKEIARLGGLARRRRQEAVAP